MENVDRLAGSDTFAQLREDYRTSDEAREGLMALILRRVEAARFGNDDLDSETLTDLARAWSYLNDGMTGTEVALDWMRKTHAERDTSHRD